MKLYNAISGNTKRVRTFISEKGLDIPTVELNLGKETRTDEFRRINSLGEVPVLETDDGEFITESLAICRYLEALFPDRLLFGATPLEVGRIEMWSQRIHQQLFLTYGLYVRHTLSLFDGVVKQVPEFAKTQRQLMPERWEWLDREMSDGRSYIAGDEFSFADIEGMTVLTIADALNIPPPEHCHYVNDWGGIVRQRSSWNA